MEGLPDFHHGLFDDPLAEEEFRSCCADGDEEWQDADESFAGGPRRDLDESSVKMFFKGMSASEDKGPKVSAIGVVMERCSGVPVILVQKKLDFYVEPLVAEHLALMDGLLVALQSGIRKIYAFTDSEKLYFQIAEAEILEDRLLVALGHRILELVDKLEDFDITLVPGFELERPSRLAQEAIGIKNLSSDNTGPCHLCREEKRSLHLINSNCSHRFCSDCLIKHIEEQLQGSHVPIRCPDISCNHCISTSECKSFLPITSYENLKRAYMERFYCPFSDCSVLLNLGQHFSARASSSSQLDLNCIACLECRRDICISCGVPWHTLMTCDEYRNLPIEERDPGDISLHRLAQNSRWRRCLQCRRMTELTQGCYHMTCWCGNEFCYSCGAEYRNGVQTCRCVFWDEGHLEHAAESSNQEPEMWTWDSFDPMPTAIEGYSEQEREQLALIQQFLAGGFSLSDLPCQSPPRCSDSYIDTMKDLHQLPWLERFVSVMSDNYNEGYIQ